MSRKAQAKILAVLTATPGLSVDEVAAVTGYTPASCQHHISELTRRGSLPAAAASPADHVPASEPDPPTTPYPDPEHARVFDVDITPGAYTPPAPFSATVPAGIAAAVLAMPEADRPSMEFVASLGLTEPEPVVVEDLRADLIAWPGHVRLWAAATAERLGITVDDLRQMRTGHPAPPGSPDETYGSLAGRIARGELV